MTTMPKYEIKIRLTHAEQREFESVDLAKAYAIGRVEKAPASVEAKLHSIVQIDPPLPDRPCPGCEPKAAPTFTLPPAAVDVEIDLPPPTTAA
jgi:hypothetical protein